LPDPCRLDQARRMKLRRSRLTCRDVNRRSPRLCEQLCNSGPVSGSAGNKERLLLRTAPKGNPRSSLFALPQPESRRGAQLRQVSAVILLRGDWEFEFVFLHQRVCELRSLSKSPDLLTSRLSSRAEVRVRLPQNGGLCGACSRSSGTKGDAEPGRIRGYE